MECSELYTFFTLQLANKARQLGCPKIVLDHVCMYNIILFIIMFVHTTMLQYMLYWRYMNWRCTSNQNTGTCKLLATHRKKQNLKYGHSTCTVARRLQVPIQAPACTSKLMNIAIRTNAACNPNIN